MRTRIIDDGSDTGTADDRDGGDVPPPLTDGGTQYAEGPPLQCNIVYPNTTGALPIGERIQIECTLDGNTPQAFDFSYRADPPLGDFTPSGSGEFIWQVTNVPTTFTDTTVTLTVTATCEEPSPTRSKTNLNIDLLGNIWVAAHTRGVVAMGSDGTNQGDAIAGIHVQRPMQMAQSADGHIVYVTQRQEPWVSAFSFSDGSLEYHFGDRDSNGPIWDSSNHPLGLVVLAERNEVWVTGMRGKVAIFNFAGVFLRTRDLGFTARSASIARHGDHHVIVAEVAGRIVHLVPLGEGDIASHTLNFCDTNIWGPIDSILATEHGYFFGVQDGSTSHIFLFNDNLSCLGGTEDGYYNVNFPGLALLGDRLVASFQMVSRCLAQYDAHTFEKYDNFCPLETSTNMYGLLKIVSPQHEP